MGVAGVTQHVEGPEVALADGEAGRAVADDGHATQVLEQLLGAADVFEEGRRAEVAGALVAIAMAGEFMTAGHDGLDHLRVALGNPAQREEGGAHVLLG
jgi:hypothetical protein